jgi:hypothetical protein
MRPYLLLVTIVGLHFSPAEAANLPKQLGQCVETKIQQITDRFGESLFKDDYIRGAAVEFRNGGRQVSYERNGSIARSKAGDRVKMCLLEIPKDCPKGDNRGRIYHTKNLSVCPKSS